MKTADLADAFPESALCRPVFRMFGGNSRFHGRVRTIRAREDFSCVRQLLSAPGGQGVLVVDGDGATDRAMLGDRLAAMAVDNGWSGIILNAVIRDSGEINAMPIGVRALGTSPLKSACDGAGEIDVAVQFAGVTFRPGDYAYADEDGILVSRSALSLAETAG